MLAFHCISWVVVNCNLWCHTMFQHMPSEAHDLHTISWQKLYLWSLLPKWDCEWYFECRWSFDVNEQSSVIITLNEPRHYAPGNRFGVSSETYKWVCRIVNRKLLKLLRKWNISVINSGARPFKLGHKSDSVFFNALKATYISSKFCKCVECHMTLNSSN